MNIIYVFLKSSLDIHGKWFSTLLMYIITGFLITLGLRLKYQETADTKIVFANFMYLNFS
jgi:hypothetical protein